MWMNQAGQNWDKEEIPGCGRGMLAWLYSDLLRALKGQHLSALLRNRGGINFCVICTALQDIRKEHFDPAKFHWRVTLHVYTVYESVTLWVNSCARPILYQQGDLQGFSWRTPTTDLKQLKQENNPAQPKKYKWISFPAHFSSFFTV